MSRRMPQTFGDFLAIAISPALIIVLLDSFLLFIISVFYQGDYAARLSFIISMFAVAVVLISRISVEEGRARAMLFALALAAVTGLAINRFVAFSGDWAWFMMTLTFAFLAFIWWCADKLVWDCTVIDEGKDASGVGLLQTAGLEDPGTDATATDAPAEPSKPSDKTFKGWWQRISSNRNCAHAPGVWVIYFSLIALPIFGFGQWFIPSSDLESRRYVFKLFCAFVAMSLALLMSSSFLGLRRYLRQRKIQMPVDIAAGWVTTGSLMIVALLVVCSLLPRPNPEYALSHVFATSPDNLKTSDHAFGNDGPESDSSQQQGGQQQGGQQQGGQQQGGQQQGGQQQKGQQQGGQQLKGQQQGGQQQGGQQQGGQQQGGQQQGGQQQGGQQQGGQQQGGQQQGGQQQGGQQPGEKSKERESTGSKGSSGSKANPVNSTKKTKSGSGSGSKGFQPTQILRQVGAGTAWFLKMLYYLIVIVVVGYVVWRYWRPILDALRNFIQAIRDFWAGLLGWRSEKEETAAAVVVPTGPPPRPFADFADPFGNGHAQLWSPNDVIRYSFVAFEAWSREHGCPRESEETPHEFVQRVASVQPQLGRPLLVLGELYGRAAYSNAVVQPKQVLDLRALWNSLTGAYRA